MPPFTCGDANPSSIWSAIGQVTADTVGIDSQNRQKFWPQKQGGSHGILLAPVRHRHRSRRRSHLLPFDEEAFPDTTVYHVTTDVICDPESFSALAHRIAHIHDIELPPDFDELVYSRRLMLHMLFGANPSTFARIYTAKDAA